jgi:hypothetical protein
MKKFETRKVMVLYYNNIPKGFMSLQEFQNFTNRKWWSEQRLIEIPMDIWESNRVHIGNIQRYVELYDENPLWWKLI